MTCCEYKEMENKRQRRLKAIDEQIIDSALACLYGERKTNMGIKQENFIDKLEQLEISNFDMSKTQHDSTERWAYDVAGNPGDVSGPVSLLYGKERISFSCGGAISYDVEGLNHSIKLSKSQLRRVSILWSKLIKQYYRRLPISHKQMQINRMNQQNRWKRSKNPQENKSCQTKKKTNS